MSQVKQDPQNNLFDRFADGYSSTLDETISLSGESGEYFTRLKIELIRDILGNKRLKPGLRFLDYGCGTGRASIWINQLFPDSNYLGIDSSIQSIRYAREHIQESNTCFMTLEESSRQPMDLFSFALSAVVFHHIPLSARPATVAYIYNLLEPGGAFFVFEHNPFNPLTRRVVKSCPFDEDAELLSVAETRDLLTSAGFGQIQTRYYFFFPRFLSILRSIERYLAWNPLGAQYVAVGWKSGKELG